MEFCLLDASLSVVARLKHITYARITRRFFAAGEITVKTAEAIAPVESARYIFEAESGVCAVIEKYSCSASGGCVLSGRTAECLFERLLVKKEGGYSGSVENAVRLAVTSFSDTAEALPKLVIGDLSGFPETAKVSFGWESLYEWLYVTLGRYGASWRLDLGDGDDFFTLNAVHGRDFTSRDTSMKTIVLREEDGHLSGVRLSFDDEGRKNVLCVVGNDGRYVTVPDSVPEGIERREDVLMARDIYPNSFENEEDYFDALRTRGQLRLASYKESVSFSGRVVGEAFTVGWDFDLGDICEVVTKNGLTLALRVTAVSTTFEKGGRATDVHFDGDVSTAAIIE